MSDRIQSIPYWSLSGFYFFYFAALGSFLPYWNLYLAQKGFNAAQIGELSAVVMATKIISPNLGGIIADKTGQPLRIIRISCFLTSVLFIGFLLKESFAWYLVISLGFSFFWNISLPQFEVATLSHLQTEPHRYSQIRLWGSVGFIIAVLCTGQYLDHQPLNTLPIIINMLFLGMWLVALIVPEVKQTQLAQSATHLLQLLKRREIIAFFSVYLLLQIAHRAYYVFYSIYLKELHYSSSTIGALWVAGVIAEVFLFMIMHKLLRLFSLRQIILTSVFLSIVRWLIIGFAADSLYWLIGAQLLHAATFGSAHIAAIHLIHQYFGQQHQAKGQSLYISVCYGVGGMIGSLFSGYYWEACGARFIYTCAAGCCVLAFIITAKWLGRTQPALKKEQV